MAAHHLALKSPTAAKHVHEGQEPRAQTPPSFWARCCLEKLWILTVKTCLMCCVWVGRLCRGQGVSISVVVGGRIL